MRSQLTTSLEFGPTFDSGTSIEAGISVPANSLERSGIIPKPAESASSQRPAHAIDEQEHIADVLRLRTVMLGALTLWGLTSMLDWSVVQFVQPAPLSYFLSLRGGAWIIMGAAVARLFYKPAPGPRVLRALDLTIFCTATLTASLLCLKYRGIASPYAHAMSCVLVARGITLPNHYKRGIPAVLVPASLFPITMGVAAQFLPEIREQFRNPAELAIFLQNLSLIVVTGALTVLGGHSMWSLRRQVFAARNIGRYRLQHRIGQGGMGEVWKAYHPSLRRAVAIKLLRANETSPSALARFEREVRATSELKHPNTVRVFDFGMTEDGLWYYAMELLEGETVGLLVEREGPLLPQRAVKLLRQASRAIAEAHARGIIHRDIKPDNLFVTSLGGERDFIKVLDFGIAKLIGEDLPENGKVTVEGSLLGTPAYMSPEQFEGHAIDARTDVFSLGAVFYFMLSGQPPFHGTTVAAIRGAHLQPIKLPPVLEEGFAQKGLEAIIGRCLEYDPTQRFQNAAELDDALAMLEHELLKTLQPPASALIVERPRSEFTSSPLAEHTTEVPALKGMSETTGEQSGLFEAAIIERESDDL